MSRLGRLCSIVVAGLLAVGGPAWSQVAPDPIGSLLDNPGSIPDEPDTAGNPVATEPEPVVAPPPLAPAAPRAPPLSAPVHIEETGKTPDAPPTLRDLAYDTRIKSSFASAQGFQGPLDGGWTLSIGGVDRYALQLVDRSDRLEGAWRDVRRVGALNGSGLIDAVERSGSDLTVRFSPDAAGPPLVLALHMAGDGRWSGALAGPGATPAATLRRSGP